MQRSSILIPDVSEVIRDLRDAGWTINENDEAGLGQTWLRLKMDEAYFDAYALFPALSTIVADLLRNKVFDWPMIQTVNVFDMRLKWGILNGLDRHSVPWCEHGRRIGAAPETCLRCFLVDNPEAAEILARFEPDILS